MKVSRAADVAVRSLVLLAVRDDEPMTLREICTSEGVSRPFLSRIFGSLSAAGLVMSHGGGRYTLTFPADQITLRMILEAIEGPEGMRDTVLRSLQNSGSSRRPALHPAWRQVQKRMVELLDAYTLECFALDAQFYL